MNKNLLFIAFLFVCTQLQAQLYTFKNYSHREGLNMGSINCMNQSDDGYLWLGTDGADLVRFDGKIFEEIVFKEKDNNHHFTSIFFDGDDILFSSLYKGFYRYKRKSNSIASLLSKKHTIGDRLNVFVLDGVYYFIGTRGIVSKKDGKEKLLKSFGQSAQLQIYQMINASSCMIITTNNGNFCLGNQKVSSLSTLLNISGQSAKKYRFGYFREDKLTLFNETGSHWLEAVFNDQGKLYSSKEFKQTTVIGLDDPLISFSYNESSGASISITQNGRMFSITKRKLGLITHNLPEPFSSPMGVLADLNGDYWVNSDLKGIYKVSEEPFTGVQVYDLLTSNEISFPYRTTDKRMFISTFSGKTYALENDQAKTHLTFDFTLYGAAEMDGICYFATDKGIKSYTPNGPIRFEPAIDPESSISFIFPDGKILWYGIRGKGLHSYHTVTKKITVINNTNKLPKYIYTAQISEDKKTIFFGTNNGVFKYNKSKKIFSPVAYRGQFGSYSGVSAKDTFGNIWFTLEKGLLVITPKIIKVIRSKDYLETNLLYTLNGDEYGNIIIGTNKGITILKVDKNGDVLRSTTYNAESGFMGYEAHMRSQFQSGNQIYIGTVEGLFAIDTKILENLTHPLRPLIFDISNEGLEDGTIQSTNAFRFKFQVNNPKNEHIVYRYRVRERSMKWQYLEGEDLIQISSLGNGTYTLEVCSSYDGRVYSESSYHHFIVESPFWQSTWFIISLIALVILINIFLLTRGKKYDSSKFLSTKDTEVALGMTPATLMFAVILVPSSQVSALLFNSAFPFNFGGTLIVGLLLLGLFLISLNAKNTGQTNQFKYLLTAALYLISAFFLWELYSTSIHPFHVIGVVILTTVSPYVLSNIRTNIIYALIIFLVSCSILLLTSSPLYPKAYFMIAIITALSMMVFNSYLRYNSLEKLLFVSGIINQGNFPVIAYREDGTVTYVSENIKNFIDIDHETLLNDNISLLNKFSLFDENYKNVDVTKGLSEGDKYLTPMTDAEQGVSWMEWSYKRFSENNQVIIGQNVSERIELQNTYELLVQNVEDLIYTVDVRGNFVFVNRAFIEKLGFSKEELIDQNSMDLVVEKYQSETREFYAAHFKEQRASTYMELPIQTKTGEVIWVGQHVNTIYAPGTKSYVNGYIALARDITEIREQQQVIKSQRDDITSSINYARKIQLNLLPHEHLFAAYFETYFLMYRPKDIVSGDFYWLQRIDNKLVIVMADCTGHGVPGAFMTLLGLNMLNSIVLDARLTEPGIILNELDKRLEDYFQKQITAEKLNDGMELTVCVIDNKQADMSYACAGSRFLIHSENGFTMYKGNNEHIGDAKSEGFTGYKTQYAPFGNDETLYLITDGFQDQFGGVNNKKFSFRRLLELFEANVNLSLNEQQKMIEAAFDDWKANQTQTDDVAIIGIRRKKI